jgi:hypothetical protein
LGIVIAHISIQPQAPWRLIPATPKTFPTKELPVIELE